MEKTLDKTSIDEVQNSYGRCLNKGNFIASFYERFLANGPEIASKFEKTDFDEQHKLLRHGINLMIMYASDNVVGTSGLKRIKESHSKARLNIEPRFYEVWKQSLLDTVADHDRKYDFSVRMAWSDVLDKGISYIAAGYK